MKDFKKLKVWQKSHKLTLEVYKITMLFPKEEVYGLTRSCASIAANIAEGCGRDGVVRFLKISAGSSSELEYHLFLA